MTVLKTLAIDNSPNTNLKVVLRTILLGSLKETRVARGPTNCRPIQLTLHPPFTSDEGSISGVARRRRGESEPPVDGELDLSAIGSLLDLS